MKSEMKGALEERVETRCSCLLWAEGSILNLDFPNPPPPQDTSKMRKSNLLKLSLRNQEVVAQPSPAHITIGPCKPT